MTPVNYVGDMSTTHSARSSAGSTGPVEITIEHKMFSEISKNWAGKPLDSYETILNYARTTRTSTGLRVNAYLVDTPYPTGVKVSDKEMETLRLRRHDTQPARNYTMCPR